jgi:Na+-transporting methylmalonyl-CoA/oxaloacetate decarboxylase gamma subunit
VIPPSLSAPFLPLATVDVGSKLGLLDDLRYQTVGIAIVLLALGTIALVLFCLGKIFATTLPAKKAFPATNTGAAPARPAASSSPLMGAGIPPEVFAVIAAAVYLELPGMNRIVEIRQTSSSQIWSMEGRRQIFQSHRLR